MVLRIRVLNSADGGDAHSVQVGAGLGGIALEVAVQGALALGDGQLVAGLREMVHADVQVSGLEKFEQPGAKNFKLLHTLREVGGEGALLFFQPRDMGVAEQSNPIGCQLHNLVDRVSEALRGLIGQAVNQIDVDAVESQLARSEEQVASHFEWLDTVYGFLYVGVEVLNTHAETVESETAQSLQVLAGSDARIDLDANFSIGGKGKVG